MDPILCSADASILVVVDIQPRLAEAMAEEERIQMFDTTALLLQAAHILEIPVLVTEQYPKGLGQTCSQIAEQLPAGVSPLAKTGFSCFSALGFGQAFADSGRTQAVLVGQESHVCVLQTAFECRQRGFDVFVVEDGVCSRKSQHKVYALERMRQAGNIITSGESVLFEWLRDANHPNFKQLAQLLH